jgi:DNA-binding response OmpR family regulator
VSASPAILVVDDERPVRLMLETALRSQGYRVVSAASGSEALAYVDIETFDVVLLDLQLGDMDGVQVLTAIRSQAPHTAVVLLTAHGSLGSAIIALRQGAFDYLLKPAQIAQIRDCVERGISHRRATLHQAELIRRIGESARALGMAFSSAGQAGEMPAQSERISVGRLSLDLRRHVATIDGQIVQLTRSEFVLLASLARQPDVVLSYSDLATEVYGRYQPDEEARALLRPHIARLRQKLEQAGISDAELISIRSVGYMLRANQRQ